MKVRFYITGGLVLLWTAVCVFADEGGLAVADEAYANYLEAERTQSVVERSRRFNRALVLFSQLEERFPSAKLYYDMANTYFHLEEPALAILYYEKALKLWPRSRKALENLAAARQKAGLESPPAADAWRMVFFFHHLLAFGERASMFLWLTAAACACWSLFIWTCRALARSCAGFCTILWALCLASLLWSACVSNAEGVMVRAALLKKDAGAHYECVMDAPLPAGDKVEVLGPYAGGAWLKVRGGGCSGYVPAAAVRTIR